MSRFQRALASLVAAIFMVSTASAHHSAADFDFSKSKTTRGVVKEFNVANPHTHATITVRDANGTHDVTFEGVAASLFYRVGYTRGMVQPGDSITVIYAPRRDGAEGGQIVGLITAKGQQVILRLPGR